MNGGGGRGKEEACKKREKMCENTEEMGKVMENRRERGSAKRKEMRKNDAAKENKVILLSRKTKQKNPLLVQMPKTICIYLTRTSFDDMNNYR